MYSKVLIILISFALVLPVWAVTYDIGPGETYETLTAFKAAITLNPGDVVDGGGNTFLEGYVLGESGTDGSPIIFQNMTLSGFVDVTWSGPDGNGEYSFTPTWDASIKNRDNSTDARTLVKNSIPVNKGGTIGSLAEGYWQWDDIDTIVYKPDDGVSHTFEVGCGELFTEVEESWYILQGMTFRGGEVAIHPENSGSDHGNNRIIRGNTASLMSHSGIWFEGAEDDLVENNTISYSHFSGIKLGRDSSSVYSTDSIVRNNTIHHIAWEWRDQNNEGHSIDLAVSSTGNIVEGNNISYGGYQSGVVGATAICGQTISIDNTTNNHIRFNYVHDNFRGGVGVSHGDGDPPQTGNKIYGNIFSNNGITGLDSDHAKRDQMDGILVVNYETGSDLDYDLDIYGNTFYGLIGDWDDTTNDRTSSSAIRILAMGGSISGIRLYNNLFLENENIYDLMIQDRLTYSVTYTEDNNLYYRSGGGDYLFILDVLYPNSNNFAAFMDATGASEDLNEEAGLINPAGINFAPYYNAPIIGAGKDLLALGASYSSISFRGNDQRDCGTFAWDISAMFFCKGGPIKYAAGGGEIVYAGTGMAVE